jgi:hypothetical protein
LQRVHKACDDLVLRLQQVSAGGVELVGPDMCAAVGVDELDIDPHPGGARLRRALQHVTHAQLLADRLGVDRLVLVSEGGVARDDEGGRGSRDARGQFVGQSVGQIVLRRIAGQIGEGQHHDGKTPSRERRLRVGGSGRDCVCRHDLRAVRDEQIPCARCYQDEQGCDPSGEQS